MFTNAICPYPVCSPSRSSIFTGRMPHETGVMGNGGPIPAGMASMGELFRAAIQRNAASIILAHNHPSGDPSPSPEDAGLTRAVIEVGKMMDISVLDHLVIGLSRWVSLRERGLGFS